MTDVAVVIGNYDGATLLPDCLESLARQTHAPVETIVVDAGSTDDSLAVAAAHGARTIVTENRGLGHLYNAGARAVQAPYVLVANNDLAFDERCVELLASALDRDSSLFAADPTQHDWSGEKLIHARTLLARGPLLASPIPGFAIDPVAPAGEIVPTAFANAGAMLVRRKMLLELGGFDETFFIDYEDLDLCWRAWARAWGSVHVPAATLRHKVGMSASPSVSPRRLASSHHNLIRFALKCLPATAAARVVAGEAVRLGRHPRPVATAFARIVAELPGIVAERRRIPNRSALLARLLAIGGRH